MKEVTNDDWFHLVYMHYNFIHIFMDNKKYIYKPFGIFRKNNTFVLQYDIVETNKIQYDYKESYRTDSIFNQEPKLLEERFNVVS